MEKWPSRRKNLSMSVMSFGCSFTGLCKTNLFVNSYVMCGTQKQSPQLKRTKNNPLLGKHTNRQTKWPPKGRKNKEQNQGSILGRRRREASADKWMFHPKKILTAGEPWRKGEAAGRKGKPWVARRVKSLHLSYHAEDEKIRHLGTGAAALNHPPDEDCARVSVLGEYLENHAN